MMLEDWIDGSENTVGDPVAIGVNTVAIGVRIRNSFGVQGSLQDADAHTMQPRLRQNLLKREPS